MGTGPTNATNVVKPLWGDLTLILQHPITVEKTFKKAVSMKRALVGNLILFDIIKSIMEKTFDYDMEHIPIRAQVLWVQ